MPNDPFGAVRTGFGHWGNRLQVATAPHRRKFVDWAVDQAIDQIPQGPVQKAAKLASEVYKRQRDWDPEFERPQKRMAYRRSRSRPGKYGRRPNRARASRRRSVPRRAPVPMMWPRQKLVKFRQVVCGSFTAAAGGATAGAVIFKANSLNDAFQGAGAQLPLGLDQWATMYGRYTVVGSRLLVRIHASSLTGGIMVGCSQLDNSSALSTHEYYMETPRTRSKLLTGDLDHTAFGMNYGAKKHFHIRKIGDAESQQATFSATPGDPTDLTYYHIWAQDINYTDGVTVEYAATIEFIVLLDDPTIPTRSSLV